MNKKEFFIVTAMILLIFLFIYSAPKLGITGGIINKQATSLNSVSAPVIITKDNFQTYLEKQSIIQDIPKKAEISLIFSDTKESYIITKSSVKKGQAINPDIMITIPSKYISSLSNFCNTIKTASINKDLGYDFNSDISKASLLWKYKGMLKYKECL